MGHSEVERWSQESKEERSKDPGQLLGPHGWRGYAWPEEETGPFAKPLAQVDSQLWNSFLISWKPHLSSALGRPYSSPSKAVSAPRTPRHSQERGDSFHDKSIHCGSAPLLGRVCKHRRQLVLTFRAEPHRQLLETLPFLSLRGDLHWPGADGFH